MNGLNVWSGCAPAPPASKLARAAKDKEHDQIIPFNQHSGRSGYQWSSMPRIEAIREAGKSLSFAPVARLVPVWDFGRPAWLSSRPDLWLDFSHYSPAVTAMMIERIFGATPAALEQFGQLRTR